MWMLLRWSTPPRSEPFDAPERSRLIVVSLLPNARRNVKGNSPASNSRSASADTASSISTAFIDQSIPASRLRGLARYSHRRVVVRTPQVKTTRSHLSPCRPSSPARDNLISARIAACWQRTLKCLPPHYPVRTSPASRPPRTVGTADSVASNFGKPPPEPPPPAGWSRRNC